MSRILTIEKFMRQRYRLPQWALFFEVPDSISVGSFRRADAIAVALDSRLRGKVLGFEFKVNRQDWLNELKQPEKAACFAVQCNEFYIVAPCDVVYADEIPENYGWLDPLAGRHLKKAAVSKESCLNVDLMCILLRRAALTCEKYDVIRRVISYNGSDTRNFETLENEFHD